MSLASPLTVIFDVLIMQPYSRVRRCALRELAVSHLTL